MCYTSLITSGIEIDCKFSVDKAIGVDKDLILVNYSDFDREGTIAVGWEEDDTNNNKYGLAKVKIKNSDTIGEVPTYVFQGTQNSVVPSFSAEELENGRFVYTHSLNFTVYNKTSEARQTLMDLSSAKVIALTKDRSTGLFEVFGMDRGLKLSSISREYVGSQNSNFFKVTLTTPSKSVLKEARLPELTSNVEIDGLQSILQGPLQYIL